jgi:glycosyltransferase involved in cell wall biosynthesis
MRILNVVSVLSAHEGGGNAERTTQLSRALSTTGADCIVLTLDIGDPEARRGQLGEAGLVVLPCLNKRFQVPCPASARLSELVRNVDVIHLMGYWSLLGVAVARAAEREGVPYVLSPAGALPLFGRSRLLKRLFNLVVGQRLVRQAAGWVAVTATELPDFQRYGVAPDRVIVVPNGVVESDFCYGPNLANEKKCVPDGQFVLFMGRLNSIKGPDLLLEAFIRVANEYPDVQLVFAGPDEGLGELLRTRVVEAGLESRILFLGFVSGRKKAAIYRAASLVVVPSRLEAMSIVAVEAGICGAPVLMTDQCGLDDIREVDPALVVSVSVDALASGLCTALRDPIVLKTKGEAWQTIVRNRFLWADIGARLRFFLETIALQKR